MGEAEKYIHHVMSTYSRRRTRGGIARTATVRDGARIGIHKRQRIRQLFGVIRISGSFRLFRDTYRIDYIYLKIEKAPMCVSLQPARI